MPPRWSVVELDAAELRAGDALDAVVLRQPLVQERVLARRGTPTAAGSRARTASKNIRVSVFMASRSSGPHSGNFCGSGLTLSRLRVSSHWPAKLSASAAERRVGQHPLHLRLEHARARAACPLRPEPQQFVVRHRAPEEVAQPRGEFEIGDLVHLRGIGGIGSRSMRNRKCGDTSIA